MKLGSLDDIALDWCGLKFSTLLILVKCTYHEIDVLWLIIKFIVIVNVFKWHVARFNSVMTFKITHNRMTFTIQSCLTHWNISHFVEFIFEIYFPFAADGIILPIWVICTHLS